MAQVELELLPLFFSLLCFSLSEIRFSPDWDSEEGERLGLGFLFGPFCFVGNWVRVGNMGIFVDGEGKTVKRVGGGGGARGVVVGEVGEEVEGKEVAVEEDFVGRR